METNGNKWKPIFKQNFSCESCDYKSSTKKDLNKHFEDHHTNWKPMETKKCPQYVCENCDKKYLNRSGLWKHKQKCLNESKKNDTTKKSLTIEPQQFNQEKLVNYLVKENSEFKELLLEQNKVIMKMCETHNTTTIINSNSNNNNKSFNLNFFLNETCKNAMNISDFVDSLNIQLTDLENVGEHGFVSGISNIIVKNLKELDVTQRPVHCTDSKREILYIKDENKWEKDDDKNMKLRKVIKNVAFKNTKLLTEFRKKHPDCGKSESKYADQYNKLVVEAMGGRGNNDIEKEDKIIKNIAKEVIISK